MKESLYTTKIIYPTKIVASNQSEDVGQLLIHKPLQVIMPCSGVTTLDADGWVVVDFGKEIYGNVRVLLGKREDSCKKLRIVLGESVAETFAQIEENSTANDHSVRDAEYLCSGFADISTSRTGFRFARIHNEGGKTQVYAVAAESTIFSAERKGFFRCNDENINEVAETALYTATLCVQNGVIWDGIKRDRLVWMGDLHPEMLTLSQGYGAIEEMKNSLDYIAYYAPAYWVNLHPSYSAWWIICFTEYYMISADEAYAKEKLHYVKEIVSEFRKVIQSDGKIDFSKSKLSCYEDCEFFFDWSTAQKEERKTGCASLIKIAMESAAKILEFFAEDGAIARTVAADVSKFPMAETDSKAVEAFNFLSARKGNEVNEKLLSGGGKGMTSFMAYYILTAAAESGGTEQVLRMIKEFYGGMLSLGATTFWEDFDVEWLKDSPQSITDFPSAYKNIHRDYGKFCYKGVRHSLCHGWAAGVYAFLTKTVLGIRATEAGYKKIEIKPNLIGLQWAEGCVPTPYGEIYVKHEMKNGKIASTVKLPRGITVAERNSEKADRSGFKR